ncbi:MAG: hypothetical protein A2V83_03940 [Nitrospirae bacterium RBG_16_64_22]|nr:MAG: hypothetical protein A2V83_03940 [Nitrospirae bacterium RBG_16_64_22]
MRVILVLSVLLVPALALADDLPAMRAGMWEFVRKAPQDPVNSPGKLSTMNNKECVKDMKALFQKQKAMLSKMCKFSETKKSGNTYTTASTCDVPQMQAKYTTRNATTVKGDSAYESRSDTEGTAAGKPVKWTETVSAKRIGDCGK